MVTEQGHNRLHHSFPDMPKKEAALVERLVTGNAPVWPRAVSPGEEPVRLKKHEVIPWMTDNLLIRFNTLTRRVEIFGEELTGEKAEAMDLYLIERCGVQIGRKDALGGAQIIARQNEYSPFVEFLESLTPEEVLEEEEWNSLDRRMLGISSESALMKLQRQLVGTVRRAMEPGYKHDTCLVLYGLQGGGKDTLLSTLFTQEFFFGGGSYDPKNKDSVLSMYGAIAVGFSEVERVFSRAGSSQLKDFLTQVDDRIRAPYGRAFEHTFRHFTFWASTNDPHLLRDGTGNRRFPWVEHKSTDVEWIKANRRRIFGTLLEKAQGDFRTYFNQEEIAVLNEEAQKLGPPDELRDGMYEGLRDGNYLETSVHHMWSCVLGMEGVPDKDDTRRLIRLMDTCKYLERTGKRARTLAQGVPAGTAGNPVAIWKVR